MRLSMNTLKFSIARSSVFQIPPLQMSYRLLSLLEENPDVWLRQMRPAVIQMV